MVLGNTVSSNKGAPADENLFTETGDTLNYPRGYHDALQNPKKTLTMVDKSEMEGDTIKTVDWARPLAFEIRIKKLPTQRKQQLRLTSLVEQYCNSIK